MGNRLSKIYTRTGDSGTTAVSDNIRISKTHPRIVALGALDTLNATTGLLLCEQLPEFMSKYLQKLQHILFDIGGELSMPELNSVTTKDIEALEQQIDKMNDQMPTLKEFILPGGSKASALCHVLRAECRNVEIKLIELREAEPEKAVRQEVLAFVNRLSDWLFVAGRFVLKQEGLGEVLWKNPYQRP